MTTAIKERPILFSGEMVRAILDGRKTQTRRIVKPQPVFNSLAGPLGEWTWGKHEKLLYSQLCEMSPYGKPPSAYFSGEWLWVRETFADGAYRADDWACCVAYKADRTGMTYLAENNGEGDPVCLDAPCKLRDDAPHKWKPPIHMPRWASRITLEITNVRVERLQCITEADAMAEGCSGQRWATGHGNIEEIPPSDEFAELWKSINGPESWDANPWVWAVSFKRI